MKFFLAGLFLGTAYGDYCEGGNTLPGDSNLGGVTLDIPCGPIAEQSDCPGQTGVIDLTSMVAEVQPGGSYTLKYDATTCGTLVYPRVTKAWIDFDNNGDFTDDEALGPVETVPMQLEPQEITWDFTPPCDAAVGEVVRLRIVVVEGGGDPDPCTSFSYGGAKDFAIEILGKNGGQCGGEDITNSNECGGAKGGGGGLDFGAVVLITIASCMLLYIALGCVFMRFKKGTKGMKESCLHFPLWASFLSLAREGVMITKAKIQSKIGGGGGGSGYEDLEDK